MRDVVETNTADVSMNDDGVPQQVNGYVVQELLGEGAFAKVYKCEKGTEIFAMKIFNKSLLKRKREFKRVGGKMVVSTAFQKVQKEVAIMKKLSHINLTRLHEVIDSPEDDKMFLVLEYVPNGQIMDWNQDSNRYINGITGDCLDEGTVRKIAADISLGIEYLHANHICHRDIKPENILVADDQSFKLSDFGVAHMFQDEDLKQLKNTEGTYHFLAPECISGQAYDPYKADIWSLGITLYATVLGTVPFGLSVASKGIVDVLEAIRTEPLLFPRPLSDDLKNLIVRMLDRNPETRITLEEIKGHAFLQITERMRGKSYPPIEAVMVSLEEINMAFTPINNIVLMTKLKIKMRGKLSKARDKISEAAMIRDKRIRSETDLLEQPKEKKKPCIIS